LGKLGVKHTKVNNKDFKGYKYVISFDELKESLIANKWLVEREIEELDMINKVDETLFFGDDKKIYDNQNNYTQLAEENKKLKEEIEQLKLLIHKPKNLVNDDDDGEEIISVDDDKNDTIIEPKKIKIKKNKIRTDFKESISFDDSSNEYIDEIKNLCSYLKLK
jgi:DNA-binding transcriptional regulator GbsR (MarR family)